MDATHPNVELRERISLGHSRGLCVSPPRSPAPHRGRGASARRRRRPRILPDIGCWSCGTTPTEREPNCRHPQARYRLALRRAGSYAHDVAICAEGPVTPRVASAVSHDGRRVARPPTLASPGSRGLRSRSSSTVAWSAQWENTLNVEALSPPLAAPIPSADCGPCRQSFAQPVSDPPRG